MKFLNLLLLKPEVSKCLFINTRTYSSEFTFSHFYFYAIYFTAFYLLLSNLFSRIYLFICFYVIGHANLPEPAVLDLLYRIYLFLCFYEIDYANQSEPAVLDLFIYLFFFFSHLL